MLDLKPITLLPARERVASSLRKAIISKQIPQGEVLTLENTAKSLGVSVTPVREAFQILSRDHLIELSQNKTAVVLGVNKKTIEDHYEMRAVLESHACRLFCERGGDLSRVRNCVEGAQKALDNNDVSSYANYNQSFHYEIWKGCQNEKILNMLSELWNGLSMGLKTTEAEYANKSQAEHWEILKEMEKQNKEKAQCLMFDHIKRSMEDILTHYE